MRSGEYAEHANACGDAIFRDVWNMALATYWERRAAELDRARPRPGGVEFYGRATPEELSRRDARLRDEAQACRNRARVALLGGDLR